MELEIAAGHDGEDEAQAVFGLERVRQVHHEPANAKYKDAAESPSSNISRQEEIVAKLSVAIPFK